MGTTSDNETLRCVGCQQEAVRSDLERFVYDERVGLVFDMRGGAPGNKEAFVHPMAGCLKAASWAGFSRAFQTPLDELDSEAIVADVRRGLRRRLVEQIGEANRQDQLRAGRRPVEKAAADGQLELLLLDPTAGGSIRRKAERIGEQTDAHLFDQIPEGLLESAFGRKVVVVGIVPGEHAERVGRTVEKLLCIDYEPE